MQTFDVSLTEPAKRDLKRLSRDASIRAVAAIEKLRTAPNSGHILTGSLRRARSLEFTAPGGHFRAAYIISPKLVIVFAIGSHENFYKLAERRFAVLSRGSSL